MKVALLAFTPTSKSIILLGARIALYLIANIVDPRASRTFGGAVLLSLSGRYAYQTSNSMSMADYSRNVGLGAIALLAALATSLDLRRLLTRASNT
jgi:hypothetical protein